MGTATFLFGLAGGGNRDRTGDLLHAMQALSQLSYTPNQGAKLYRLLVTRSEPAAAHERARLQAQALRFADEIDLAVECRRGVANAAGTPHRHAPGAREVELVVGAAVAHVRELAFVRAARLRQDLLRIGGLFRRETALLDHRPAVGVRLQRALDAELPVAGLDTGMDGAGQQHEKEKPQSVSKCSERRCRTVSRPRSSSTASIDGVWLRPVTSRRSGIASCGILRPLDFTTSLMTSFSAGRSHFAVARRAFSMRRAFATVSSQSGVPGSTSMA